jgi:diaminohydroxyphosphoribosylaminopyrimidine deaminase/5-amino-6-(5-phosphoribosylamino)uracil reductase
MLLAADRRGRLPLARVLAALGRRDIQSVLVEGGAQVHGAVIDARLFDRVAVFVAPKLVGAGVPIAAGNGWPVPRAVHLGPLSVDAVGEDLLIRGDVLARR